MESLVPSHLAPLSGCFSHHRIYYGAPRYACGPCVLIDQDDADVLRLVILLINGMVPTDNSGRVIMEGIR